MQQRQTLVLLGLGLLAAGGCKKENPATGAAADGGSAAAPAAAAPGEPVLALLGQFEGEIDLSMTSHEERPTPAPPVAMNLFIKSGKVRADVPEKLGGGSGLGPGAYFILDAAAKKLEIVSNVQKQVFVIDFNTSGDKLKALGGGAQHGPAHVEPKTTVTKTGKTETVAGRKCEDWDVVSDHREGTACVAEEDVRWFQIPLSGFPSKHAWAAALLDGKHLPLRFVGYGKDGSTEQNRVEVTKFEKKSLPATEFEYPATYGVSDFGQLFAGLAGMRGGMPGGMPPGMPGGMPPGMPPGMMPTMPPRHQP